MLLAPFLSEGFSLDDAASLQRGNAHLAELVKDHPDRLVGFAVFDPRDRDAPQHVRHAIEVFNEFDLAVSSSHSEAMPFAVMEAMACGLPVVACKVGGGADLIQHGVTGYIANDNDHDGLASRVTDLIDDPTLLATFGAAGRKRACARFSLTRSVEATTSLLARLGEQRAEPRRIGALHEAARPLRPSNAAVKASR